MRIDAGNLRLEIDRISRRIKIGEEWERYLHIAPERPCLGKPLEIIWCYGTRGEPLMTITEPVDFIIH